MPVEPSYEARIISVFRPNGCGSSWKHDQHGFRAEGAEAHACLLETLQSCRHDHIHWQLIQAVDGPKPPLPTHQPHPSIAGLLRHQHFVELAGALELLVGAIPRDWIFGPYQLRCIPSRKVSEPDIFHFDPFRVADARNPQRQLLQTRITLHQGQPFYLGLGSRGSGKLVLLAMTFTRVNHEQL
jgi:hypothetical protein